MGLRNWISLSSPSPSGVGVLRFKLDGVLPEMDHRPKRCCLKIRLALTGVAVGGGEGGADSTLGSTGPCTGAARPPSVVPASSYVQCAVSSMVLPGGTSAPPLDSTPLPCGVKNCCVSCSTDGPSSTMEPISPLSSPSP